jgi:hypothetical protein
MQSTSSSRDTEHRLTTHSIVEPAQSVAAVTREGRTVLLEQTSGRYFGLSDVGSRIWELIDQRVPPLEIVDRLEAEYDTTRDQLVEDTSALLSALLSARLIRWE